MRSRGFLIGSAMVAAMAVISGMAFVETAYPVQAGQTDVDAKAALCPSGASGPVSTCAEVHAQALAAGTMSRASFEFAQAQLVALAAHTSGS